MTNKAVFLDRDGTLIKHYDYLTEMSQVELVETAVTALKYLKERGYLLILVTNQSGVARGFLTESRLRQIHGQLSSLLAKHGVYLDAIYYCPYHPEAPLEQYRRDSDLRKPRPGMLLQAAAEHDIDLSRSWMIGDDDRDILAGQAAGCRTILIQERGSRLVRRGESQPDYRAGNLQEAANVVIHYGVDRSGPPPTEPERPPLADKADEAAGAPLPPTDDRPSESFGETRDDDPGAWQTMEPDNACSDRTEPAPAGDTAVTSDQPPTGTDKPGHSSGPQPVEMAEDPGSADLPVGDDTRRLLERVVRELRQIRHDRQTGDNFSAFRLIGMVLQMVVVLCLVMALRAGSGSEPDTTGAYMYLMVALVFQTMTLTFLVGFK